MKIACNSSERIRMSEFTRVMLVSLARSKTRAQSRQAGTRKAARQSQRPTTSPDHSARKVAKATPSTPQPSPSTNHRSSTMLSRFIQTCMTSSARVRSSAMSQPEIP